MCVNPSVLDNGISIGCRNCWQCRLSKKNEIVGKCLAEAEVSTHAYFVTLTYGRDAAGDVMHEASTVLTLRHTQLFLKRLRNAGFKPRYVTAGEYGSEKGRAHWHMLLFFRGGHAPDWPINQRFHSPFWADDYGPRGFVHVAPLGYSNALYAAKYLTKEIEGNVSRVTYSRFPPLGSEYLLYVAREMARAGVVPRFMTYKLRVLTPTGLRDVSFKIVGVMRDRFMQEWLETYLSCGFVLDPTGEDSPLVNSYIHFGRVVNYDLAYEADYDKRVAEAKADARIARLEDRAASLTYRYIPYNIPSNIGEYFWRTLEDVSEIERPPREFFRQLLAECRATHPNFNPYSPLWRRSWQNRGILNPIAGRKLDCDREPSRERTRKRKLVARVRKFFL